MNFYLNVVRELFFQKLKNADVNVDGIADGVDLEYINSNVKQSGCSMLPKSPCAE